MERIPCYMDFDKRTHTVTLRHAKTNTIQMILKLEAGMSGTMERLTPMEDCDNFWIALKPADSTVFEDKLFGPKQIIVEKFKFFLS